MKFLLVFCSIFLIMFVRSSDRVYADRVDTCVNTYMHRWSIAGVSLAVIKDGKVVKERGYGYANIETKTPATPHTVYKIASVSKQFLAAGVMILVGEGKVDLQDKISKYLVDSPSIWKDITVEEVLNHTSGLVEDPPGYDPYKMESDADTIKSAYATPLLSQPGEQYNYSNLGYYIVGEIIRKASGESWADFLQKRLFDKVGMSETRISSTTDIIHDRAMGYDWNDGQLVNAEQEIAVRPSGGYLSTVQDMVKWDDSLKSDAVLSSTIKQKMWTVAKLNDGSNTTYGLGWDLTPWFGHNRVSHTGYLPGFLCDYERFTDDGLTIIVLTNTTRGDPAQIVHKIAGFYIPSLALPPIPDKDPTITSNVKKMISGMRNGHLDMTLFTPEIASWLAGGGLSGSEDGFRKPGMLISTELIYRSSDKNYRTFWYRVTYPQENLLFRCTFTKDNIIQSYGIQVE